MTDKKNIPLPNHQSSQFTEDLLVAYLNGSLSPEKQHEVEEWLSNEGMESDAVEGLQNLNSNESKAITQRINHKLKKQLKTKRNKNRFIGMEWSWLFVLIIILLAVAAYLVLRMMVG